MNKEELKAKYGKKRIPCEWRATDIFTQMVTTFLGSGMSPKAPGTMGSVAAAVAAFPMALLFDKWQILFLRFTGEGATSVGLNMGFLAAALFVFFAAIPFVKKAMKDTHTEDPGWIVIDEVCGIFMALALIPSVMIVEYPWILIIAFGLFRFFDILKPLGIHHFEKFPGAWGVMADDLLGGVYAAAGTLAIAWIFLT